jgi:hypothetical protein
MKVKIGSYHTWVGPYQIAEMLCFWAKDVEDEYGMKSKPDFVHNFGTWLAENKDGSDTKLNKFCNWVESKRNRQVYVCIDKFDTWSMDHTLAQIIAPMLKQLQDTKHGAPFVSDEDVPNELRSTSALPTKNEWDTDDNHFKRWDWVLNEMIFAFEAKQHGTWQDKYSSGEHDWSSEPFEWDGHGKPKMFRMVTGPNDTYKCDYEGMQVEQTRITNGFKLFGKYYENLWD